MTAQTRDQQTRVTACPKRAIDDHITGLHSSKAHNVRGQHWNVRRIVGKGVEDVRHENDRSTTG